jgi:hypothetical protein
MTYAFTENVVASIESPDMPMEGLTGELRAQSQATAPTSVTEVNLAALNRFSPGSSRDSLERYLSRSTEADAGQRALQANPPQIWPGLDPSPNSSVSTPAFRNADKPCVSNNPPPQAKQRKVLSIGMKSCPFEGCTFSGRTCDLSKHMKRHQKPYGCTYPRCYESFGGMSDWKRHENSQHFQLEAFRCDYLNASRVVCGQHYHRSSQFEKHLAEAHHLDSSRFEATMKRCRIGRNGQGQFWCGFCTHIRPLTMKRNAAWEERFDHIAHHIQKEKRRIEDWHCVEENKPKGQYQMVLGEVDSDDLMTADNIGAALNERSTIAPCISQRHYGHSETPADTFPDTTVDFTNQNHIHYDFVSQNSAGGPWTPWRNDAALHSSGLDTFADFELPPLDSCSISSNGSVYSFTSVHSYRSYDARGPRRGRRAWIPSPGARSESMQPKLEDPRRRFACTWPGCMKYSKNRSAWTRHEEAVHHVPYRWICCSEAPAVNDPDCFLCVRKKEPSQHSATEHFSSCALKEEKDRTFYRQDQFAQHIHRVHCKDHDGKIPDAFLISCRTPNPGFNETSLICGFCGYVSPSWEQRKDHVFAHLKANDTKQRKAICETPQLPAPPDERVYSSSFGGDPDAIMPTRAAEEPATQLVYLCTEPRCDTVSNCRAEHVYVKNQLSSPYCTTNGLRAGSICLAWKTVFLWGDWLSPGR